MSIGLMILLFFAAVLVFFVALGYFTKGSGGDLIDWDPVGRARARRVADVEDEATLREVVGDDAPDDHSLKW